MPQIPNDTRLECGRTTAQDQAARTNSGQPAELDADEREFEVFAQEQDPLDIAAATWVTRKRSELSPAGEAELKAWLDADPRHAQAFEAMDATFGAVQQLSDDETAQFRAGLEEPDATAQGAALSGQHGLPSLLRPLAAQTAAAAFAFSLVGCIWLGWSHWQSQAVFEQAFATARGQQLSATLPDSAIHAVAPASTLQLDTATQTHVRLYRDRREVHLHSGQAMFAVHRDSLRPFYVYVGELRVTVIGTRFSVRHTATGLDAGHTVVAVEEGRVRLDRLQPGAKDSAAAQVRAAFIDAPPDQAVELSAGQTVVADAQGRIGPVTTLAGKAIAPWREGRLSFDQVPLAQAIAEFERYGRTGLMLRDPALAALPVGGSFSLEQWHRFAEALPQVLPVRLVRHGEVTEVVAQ
ncbi:FecR family protein [Roseateles sp.]|uniref:FecR family protein n=1 Tax=Roseateles sp. TaxID=1971397 RepID=UPI003BA54895